MKDVTHKDPCLSFLLHRHRYYITPILPKYIAGWYPLSPTQRPMLVIITFLSGLTIYSRLPAFFVPCSMTLYQAVLKLTQFVYAQVTEQSRLPCIRNLPSSLSIYPFNIFFVFCKISNCFIFSFRSLICYIMLDCDPICLVSH